MKKNELHEEDKETDLSEIETFIKEAQNRPFRLIISDYDETITSQHRGLVYDALITHIETIRTQPDAKLLVLSAGSSSSLMKTFLTEHGVNVENIIFIQTNMFQEWYSQTMHGNSIVQLAAFSVAKKILTENDFPHAAAFIEHMKGLSLHFNNENEKQLFFNELSQHSTLVGMQKLLEEKEKALNMMTSFKKKQTLIHWICENTKTIPSGFCDDSHEYLTGFIEDMQEGRIHDYPLLYAPGIDLDFDYFAIMATLARYEKDSPLFQYIQETVKEPLLRYLKEHEEVQQLWENPENTRAEIKEQEKLRATEYCNAMMPTAEFCNQLNSLYNFKTSWNQRFNDVGFGSRSKVATDFFTQCEPHIDNIINFMPVFLSSCSGNAYTDVIKQELFELKTAIQTAEFTAKSSMFSYFSSYNPAPQLRNKIENLEEMITSYESNRPNP